MTDITNFFLGKPMQITESKAFERIKDRAKAAEEKKQKQKQIQGELFPKPWATGFHGLGANTLVRSAIFGTHSRSKTYMETKKFSYEKAVSLVVQGKALNQIDYDVFQLLLTAAAACDIVAGAEFQFTRYAFLKTLGWSVDSKSYARLDEALSRLSRFVLALEIAPCALYPAGWKFEGSLVQKSSDVVLTESSMIRLSMHRDLANFFAPGLFHSENLEQRKALGKNQLAKALHAFYSSHIEPIPIPIEGLQLLVGDEQELKHFKQQLKVALEALVKVGFFSEYKLESKHSGIFLNAKRSLTNEEWRLFKNKKTNTAQDDGQLVRQVTDFIHDQKAGVAKLQDTLRSLQIHDTIHRNQ